MKFDLEGFKTEAVLQAYRFVDASVDELQIDLTTKEFKTVKGDADLRALPITINLSITKEFAQEADKATVDQALIRFKRNIQGA